MFKEVVKIGLMFIDIFIFIIDDYGNFDIVYENLDEYFCFLRILLLIISCFVFCW